MRSRAAGFSPQLTLILLRDFSCSLVERAAGFVDSRIFSGRSTCWFFSSAGVFRVAGYFLHFVEACCWFLSTEDISSAKNLTTLIGPRPQGRILTRSPAGGTGPGHRLRKSATRKLKGSDQASCWHTCCLSCLSRSRARHELEVKSVASEETAAPFLLWIQHE